MRSRIIRGGVTAAVLAVVALALGRLLEHSGVPMPGAEDASNPALPAKAATGDALAATTTKRRTDNARSAGIELVSASPFAHLGVAYSARQLEHELIERAHAGDTAAIAVMLELMARCAVFYPAPGETYHPRQELEHLPAESSERRTREYALRLQETFCDRPYAPGETAAMRAEFRARLKEGVASGDVVARADNLFKGEGEDSIRDAFHGTDEPWIAERALLAFSVSKGPEAHRIDQEVFPSDLLLSTAVQQRLLIKQMAARWHACTMGGACGPNQSYELNQCIYVGNCGIGLSVQAFIQQRELSGRQFELMQRYLAAIKELRGSGGG